MNDIETMMIFSSTDSLKIDTTKYNEVTGAAGIPEFGTPFVRGILELTKPTTFGELVTISGLSHGTDVWFRYKYSDNVLSNSRHYVSGIRWLFLSNLLGM